MGPQMKKTLIVIAILLAPLGGCADLTPGQQRALTGTAIGTAGGAAIGALAGNAALGAGIGAGAGLAGGLLTNAWRVNQERSFQQGFQAGQQLR
jgi:Glycine-zipper domain